MRLKWPLRLGRRLEWTAQTHHPLEFELRQPRWPPFFATAFFLPRIKVWVKNRGEELPDTSFGLYVRQYDGPAGSIPSLAEDWVDTSYCYPSGPWKPDKWQGGSRYVLGIFPTRARMC